MKILKITLVAIALFINYFCFASPSWAGQDHTKSTDYAEVTQSINQLLQIKDTPDQAGYTPEQFQKQLAKLQAQKRVMESTTTRAQCHNETAGTMAVYANRPKKSPTQLYFLGAGTETDDDWDCDGFYLPAGTPVALEPNAEVQELTEPIAVKFTDGTQSIARMNPTTGAVELNVSPATIFKAGDSIWSVPTLSQAEINAQTPNPELID